MPNKAVSFNATVYPISEKKKESSSFGQSLHVIVTGLRILGIPLDLQGIHSKWLRYWSLGFGLIMLMLNVTVCMTVLVNTLATMAMKKKLSIADWNLVVNEFNFTILLVGSHIVLLGWTAPNWKKVMKILQKIERLNLFKPEDYEKFRRFFRAVIPLFLFLVICQKQLPKMNNAYLP